MRIALTGNPNSGKTTMFNALTGSNEKVGNWAGVTVEKKEHSVKKQYSPKDQQILAVDLPGAYSMSPFTSEESITSAYVRNENPDVIVNIVDATNLSRSLFFTTQLLELGIPLVVALNKADINDRKQTKIDTQALSRKLDCPVVETVSTSSRGLKKLMEAALQQTGRKQVPPYHPKSADISSRALAEAADKARFAFVNEIVAQVEKRSVFPGQMIMQDKIDAIITHPLWGLLIFAGIMFGVFWLSQAEGGPGIRLAGLLETGMEAISEWVGGLVHRASPILQALVVDGIVGGVGAVLGFLPLVMVMYFLIALLEDCGYMARATVVLDPIFKKVGLSGKSVIPFVVGTGCAVPGIMSSRTIRNERERRATVMLAPFMPCGAKLPVIALFAGAFFAEAGWVGPMMYFVGIVIIFFGALLINKITGHKARKSYFIIELPEYKLPSVKRAFLSMLSRGWAYIVKAGTIILLCNTVVQVMQSFSWNFLPAESAEVSILASVARPFAYLLLPVIGTVSWQMAAAVLTGFIAKENVVGTLAVCFAGLHHLIDMEEMAMLEGAGGEIAGIMAISKAAALAYLMFNLFTPPCFAAIGAMNAEMKSRKWFFGGLGLQMGVGYTLSFLVYQLGTLITTGTFGAAFLPGLMVAAIFAGILVYLIKKGQSAPKKYEQLSART